MATLLKASSVSTLCEVTGVQSLLQCGTGVYLGSQGLRRNGAISLRYGDLDRLCGLVVRVLGYRSGGPGSIPGITRKKNVVCLERGALSVMSTN
jgi:hypothetical protein